MLQLLKKITVSRKKLAVQGEITARRTSSMALGRYVAAAEKCGLAAGSVCSAAGKKDFLAFGKKVTAVGKCVQLPGVYVQPPGKRIFWPLEKKLRLWESVFSCRECLF